MIPHYDLGCVYKILEIYQRSIMDVKTFPELWGVGVVEKTIVQKWDPLEN